MGSTCVPVVSRSCSSRCSRFYPSPSSFSLLPVASPGGAATAVLVVSLDDDLQHYMSILLYVQSIISSYAYGGTRIHFCSATLESKSWSHISQSYPRDCGRVTARPSAQDQPPQPDRAAGEEDAGGLGGDADDRIKRPRGL